VPVKAWRDQSSGDMCFQFQGMEFSTLVGLVLAGAQYYENTEIPRVTREDPKNGNKLGLEVRGFRKAFNEMVSTRNIAPQLLEGGKVKEVSTR